VPLSRTLANLLVQAAAVVARSAAPATAAAPDDGWRAAAVLEALRRSVADPVLVLELAAVYDRLLLQAPHASGGSVVWRPVAAHARRRLGAFATPPQLARALVDRALDPWLEQASPGSLPLVVDPACGAGALLIAALDRLVVRGVAVPQAISCLRGIDIDPVAAALANGALVARAAQLGVRVDLPRPCVVVGDTLVDAGLLGPGGVDVVLANPPWERLKVLASEHVGAGLEDARALVRGRVHAVRTAGRHPLTGAGDLNAHLPFTETCWRLLAPGGRAALLLPEGVLTDRQAGPLMRALLAAGHLESVHALGRSGPRLPGVSVGVQVAVVTLARPVDDVRGAGARVATEVADPGDAVGIAARAWSLDLATVHAINPGSGTAALFAGPRDAALVVRAHERCGVLLRRDLDGVVVHDPWRFRARTPVHLSRDASAIDAHPGPGRVPLLEAKLLGLLDPRAATWDDGRVRPPTPAELADPRWLPATRWWVTEALWRNRYGDLIDRGWLGAYRIVTTPRTARTLLPVALPVLACANSLALLTSPRLPLLLAALSSMPMDYVARAKAGGSNLSLFKVEQLPVPPPQAYDQPAAWQPTVSVGQWVLHRWAAAIPWCAGLAPLATELGVEPVVLDASARALARADVDAAHAHLLGWTTSDLEHVLGTFGVLREREERERGRYLTRDRVLAAFESLGPVPGVAQAQLAVPSRP
jgi:hypothetical protein